MPLHDWTRVDPGVCHGFHTLWTAETSYLLTDLLPRGYYAFPEQKAGRF